MEKKITKRDYYEMLKEIVLNANVEGTTELVEFIDKQVSLIDSKAEKDFAQVLEQSAEVQKWLRPHIKQFNIYNSMNKM